MTRCKDKCHECLDEVQTVLEKFHRHMVCCPTCGNKRCPKADSCRYKCTGSNEVGQVGEEVES